jgi:hypothetical protein
MGKGIYGLIFGIQGASGIRNSSVTKGDKSLGTTTRLDNKVDYGVLTKRKVLVCVRGDQQTEESFKFACFENSRS